MSEKLEKYAENRPEAVAERPWVAPRVDIYENDSEVLLLADLPGVVEDTLSIHLDKDQLGIDGRVGPEPGWAALGQEYRSVDYRRTFVVPPGIDGGKIVANLKNGVLALHLPKADSLRSRRIEVKAG